jgi:hypothetical protein
MDGPVIPSKLVLAKAGSGNPEDFNNKSLNDWGDAGCQK